MKGDLKCFYLLIYNKEMKLIASDWGYYKNKTQAQRAAETWMWRICGYYCHVEECYR